MNRILLACSKVAVSRALTAATIGRRTSRRDPVQSEYVNPTIAFSVLIETHITAAGCP